MKNKKINELIRYILIGGCTTLINFIIFYVFTYTFQQGWLFANVVAWTGAVIFAFFFNRNFVFKSSNDAKREAFQFFFLRVITLLIENVLLFLLIDCINVHSMVSKVIVAVFTVLSNYWLCKFTIFNNGGELNEKD